MVVVVDEGGGEVVVVVSSGSVVVVDVVDVVDVVTVQLFRFRVSRSVLSLIPVERISTSVSTRQSEVFEPVLFCVKSATLYQAELPGPAGSTCPGQVTVTTLYVESQAHDGVPRLGVDGVAHTGV